MAKKNKKKDDLPEGMSRRQAKLAARAAERAALEKDPRPYGGFAAEADLVALQEFVPSAVAKLDVKGIDRDVHVVTVLPGGGAALIREAEYGGGALVALQVQSRSHNPGRDLAYTLNWVKDAQPGQSLGSTIADGTEPPLTEFLDPATGLEVTEHQDFNWWLPEGADVDMATRQAMQNANDAVIESHRVRADVPGSVWWANPGGGKAYIRWVRVDDNEDATLRSLACVAARGELSLGEGTKFAGVFRTHGIVAPVFDLAPEVPFDSYAAQLERVDAALEKELTNDAQLTADEHRQLQNIKSRQVTIR